MSIAPDEQLRDGVAIIDKAADWTSHDVVAKARGILRNKKIGHSGTLDPDATGVLVLGVGRVTRLLRFLTALPKTYVAEIVLGVETSTLDASGTITASHDMRGVTVDAVRAAAALLTGPILQIPPMVSAVKIGGTRLHELARQGKEIDRPPRPVIVYGFTIDPVESALVPSESVRPGPDRPAADRPAADRPAADRLEADRLEADRPEADRLDSGETLVYWAEVRCSSGTYVRTLAADLGHALGGGAHLRALRRTAIGSFTLADARPLTEIQVLPAGLALRDYPSVVVGDETAVLVRNGRVLDLDALRIPAAVRPPMTDPLVPVDWSNGPWAVFDELGELLAVYEPRAHATAKPAVVLRPMAT